MTELTKSQRAAMAVDSHLWLPPGRPNSDPEKYRQRIIDFNMKLRGREKTLQLLALRQLS